MNKENQSADNERIYPCVKCGKMRTKAEGGTTFSLCEECWDEAYPTKPADNLLLTDEEVKEELKKYFTDEQMQFQEPEFTIISSIIAVVRKAQLTKLQPILDANKMEIAELKKSVSELLDAMHRYEMDVEVEAPFTHREMMKRAELALSIAKLKAGEKL